MLPIHLLAHCKTCADSFVLIKLLQVSGTHISITQFVLVCWPMSAAVAGTSRILQAMDLGALATDADCLLLFSGYRGLYPRGYSSRGVKLITHVHLLLRL
jgi:hypothetical protein